MIDERGTQRQWGTARMKGSPGSIDRLENCTAQRICIIKPSAMGDVVQTLPILPALRERFPQARICWVISRSLQSLVQGHPDLDDVILYDRRGSWRDWWTLLRRLRGERFDLVFDLQGLLRSACMSWATGARLRIGLETAREGSHLACHTLLPDTGRLVPAHLRYWRVAEALGLGHLERKTDVVIQRADLVRANEWLSVVRGARLAVQPGARWQTKQWPVERFAAVAAKAYRQFGFSSIVVGGPEDRALGTEFEMQLKRFVPAARVLNLVGQTSLTELAAVLLSSDAMLSNDSGPMHLAAALQLPVVGVFTCTDPVRSGPPPGLHELVSAPVSCAGSYKKKCPHRGCRQLECFTALEVERVWQAFQQMVRRSLPSRVA